MADSELEARTELLSRPDSLYYRVAAGLTPSQRHTWRWRATFCLCGGLCIVGVGVSQVASTASKRWVTQLSNPSAAILAFDARQLQKAASLQQGNFPAGQESAMKEKWNSIAQNAAGELSRDMDSQWKRTAQNVTKQEEAQLRKEWDGGLERQSGGLNSIVEKEYEKALHNATEWAHRAESGWDQNMDNSSSWTSSLGHWWSNMEKSAEFQEAVHREKLWQKQLKAGFQHRLGDFGNASKEINRLQLKRQMMHAVAAGASTAKDLTQQANVWRGDINGILHPDKKNKSQEVCSDLNGLYIEKVLHSNLGGHGPDKGEASLIFVSNHTRAGVTVKRLMFKIVATSPYSPGWNMMNGLSHGLVGKYGQVTLKPGTNVSLRISLYDLQSGKKIHMPTAAFTFFDLDEDLGHEASEFITVGGFTSYELSNGTEVRSFRNADRSMTFQASTQGTFEDNPVDPLLLTEQQKNRAVTVRFTNSDDVTVVLGATAAPHDPGAWRCFTFVAHPVLKCAKTLHEKSEGGPSDIALMTAGLVCLVLAICIGLLCCCL